MEANTKHSTLQETTEFGRRTLATKRGVNFLQPTYTAATFQPFLIIARIFLHLTIIIIIIITKVLI